MYDAILAATSWNDVITALIAVAVVYGSALVVFRGVIWLRQAIRNALG